MTISLPWATLTSTSIPTITLGTGYAPVATTSVGPAPTNTISLTSSPLSLATLPPLPSTALASSTVLSTAVTHIINVTLLAIPSSLPAVPTAPKRPTITYTVVVALAPSSPATSFNTRSVTATTPLVVPLPTDLKYSTLLLTQSLLAPAVQSVGTGTVPTRVTQTVYYVPVATTIPYISVSTAIVTKAFTVTPDPSFVVLTLRLTRTVTGAVETITRVHPAAVPTANPPGPASTLLSLRNNEISLSPDIETVMLTTPSSAPIGNEANYVNKGAIVGGVVGTVVGVLILLGAFTLIIRWHQRGVRNTHTRSLTALENSRMEEAYR